MKPSAEPSQVQSYDPKVRFSDCTFADKGVPPIVRHAHRYFLSKFGDSQEETISAAECITKAVIEEFKTPQSEFLRMLLALTYDVKRGISPNGAPDIVTPAMLARVSTGPIHSLYTAAPGTVWSGVGPLVAFQTDILASSNQLLSQLTEGDVTDAAIKSVDEISSLVCSFFSMVVERRNLVRKLRPKPSETYSKVISENPSDLNVAKLFISDFCSLQEISLTKGTKAVSNFLSPSPLKSELSEWAKKETPFTIADVSPSEREEILTRCQKGAITICDEAFLRVLDLQHALKTDQLLDETTIISSKLPNWHTFLATALRLSLTECNQLSEARSDLLARLGRDSNTVSVDILMHAWPKITEVALLTDPAQFKVYSDLPQEAHLHHHFPVEPSVLSSNASIHAPIMLLAPSSKAVVDYELELLRNSTGQQDGPEVERIAGALTRQRVSAFLNSKRITGAAWVIEGREVDKPKAFGAFELVERDIPNFTRKNYGSFLTVYLSDEEEYKKQAVVEPSPKSNVREQERAPHEPNQPASLSDKPSDKSTSQPAVNGANPLPPSQQSPSVPETPMANLEARAKNKQPPPQKVSVKLHPDAAEEAKMILAEAEKFGVLDESSMTSVLKVLTQLSSGTAPKPAELRITKSMKHDMGKTITGLRYTIYELALPLLERVREELQRSSHDN